MSGSRARLFVALELPRIARAALAQWRGEQLGEIQGLALVDPSALHVTLCFLGSQPLEEVEAISSACARLSDQPRVALSLGETLWLPRGRPHVVAIKLEDRRRRLADLQSELSRALSGGGWYEPERRPFLAHVTLARVLHGVRVRPVDLPAPVPMSFPGTDLTLFRSHPGEVPAARYERLARVRLGPERAG